MLGSQASNVTKMAIEFSIGRNQYDSQPKYGAVDDFQSFVDIFERIRAPRKGTYYIAPSFRNDGRRCNKNCNLHRFAAFDLDGGALGKLTDSEYSEICFQMSAWRGFAYETSSSTSENRRARFVLELDRPVDRISGQQIRRLIRELMPSVGRWDSSCDNPAQPLFMPGKNVAVKRFGESPVPVDQVLMLSARALQKHKPISNKPRTSRTLLRSQLGRLKSLGCWKSEVRVGLHRIRCPWAHLHSDDRSDAYYFEPADGNGQMGGFHCFHDHCSKRNIGHLVKWIDGGDPQNAD